MGIHRARFALALMALAGLAGCTSSGNNNQAFWKTNPFASKTASATSKPEYPAKPSTQVANPAGSNAPATGGLASRPSSTPSGISSKSSTAPPASTAYPGATTSFNAPSGAAGSGLPAYGAPGGTASTMDPTISPQRGPYSSSAYNAGNRATAGGVGTPTSNPYATNDSASRYNTASATAGFKSGAKDYTAPPTDYASPAGSASARGGVTIPRYNASADRYGTPASPDRAGTGTDRYSSSTDRYATNPTAAGMDRYGSGARSGSSYDPIGAARSNSPSPYGPNASMAGAASVASRGGMSDPFQANNRSTPPGGSGLGSSDRNPAVYSNPYANTSASRPAAGMNDRAAPSTNDRFSTPSYRDYPATGASSSPAGRTNSSPAAGNFAPASSATGAPSGDYRSNTNGAGPASDYRSTNMGQSSPSASYRSTNGSAPPSSNVAADDAPPFRPGSTSDYVPRSANPGPAANAAGSGLSGSRIDTSARPSSYNSGAADYMR